MDIREIEGEDFEEAVRACVLGHLKAVWGAMPTLITQDTTDGHVAVAQPTVKRSVTDLVTGAVTYEDHPEHPDQPIHYAGGGKVVATHPVKKGDEGLQIFASRCIDAWHQQGGTAQPMEERLHSLADGIVIPGIRSDPRKLAKVDPDAHHVRSVDKKHVAELHPDTGHHVKSADPSSAPASASFDPFTQASTFFEHLVHPTSGVAGNATDGGTTHSHGVNHTEGAFMRALNALHSVLCHPSQGAMLSAQGGEHVVQAHPTQGVMVQSSQQVGIMAPSTSISGNASIGGMLSAGGGISFGGGGGGGNTMTSTQVDGDLAGSLPDPQVVGITHVANANTLPVAASDAAAATAGVVVGGLYRNTAVMSGVSVLAVRMA